MITSLICPPFHRRRAPRSIMLTPLKAFLRSPASPRAIQFIQREHGSTVAI